MPICYLRTEQQTLQRIRSSAISTDNPARDAREQTIADWLHGHPSLADAELRPASSDASFRRYFRVQKGDFTRIIMDAPPEREDCEPYVRIAGQLHDMGLNVPVVESSDLEQGILLLSDLGSLQYFTELKRAPERADELYTAAIGALLRLQQRGAPLQASLPAYSRELLTTELAIFEEWLCNAHLGVRFTDSERVAWQDCCEILIQNALAQRRVWVHRDYHSRNLMVMPEHSPGILDFQDAVEGPYTYDLVSLLRDCYLRWSRQQVRDWSMLFFDVYRQTDPDGTDEATFLRHFDLTGMQRHLKAAGIFARLRHRDGKSAYLPDIPRTLGYVTDVAAAYPELHFIGELLEQRILPAIVGDNP